MTVLVGRLDPYVVRRVASYLTALAPDDGDEDLDPRLVAVAERWTVYRSPEVDAETRDLAAAIDDAKASLAALGDDFHLHGRFPGAEGRQRYDRLSARLTERLAGLQELQIARRPPPLDVGPVLDLVNSIGEDDVPPALFADVVRLVVDRVVVTPAARRGERFSTDRVIIDPLDTTGRRRQRLMFKSQCSSGLPAPAAPLVVVAGLLLAVDLGGDCLLDPYMEPLPPVGGGRMRPPMKVLVDLDSDVPLSHGPRCSPTHRL
jgi:hypothetical protein